MNATARKFIATRHTAPEGAVLAHWMKEISQKRDRAAFASLYSHFAPRVKTYLCRLGLNAEQSEELSQEVMFTVWRRADSYNEGLAGVSTWIFRIARNRRLDLLRAERRPEDLSEDDMLLPQPMTPADEIIDAAEWETRIREAIAELPPEQAELLRLSFYEGMSHSDIAAERDLPLGTVKSRIRLALRAIGRRLGDAWA